MAASTVKSSLFDNPTYPRKLPAGPDLIIHKETIKTTSLDEANDRVKLIPLPNAIEILYILLDNADLDSGGGALDADLVIADDDGDTIVYNAGTAFAGAQTGKVIIVAPGTKVVKAKKNAGPGQSDVASLDLLVNTAASTAAEGAVTVVVAYKNAP